MQFEKSSRSKSNSSQNDNKNRNNSIDIKIDEEVSNSRKSLSNRSLSESYLAKNKREMSQNSKNSNNDFQDDKYYNNTNNSNSNKMRSNNNSKAGSRSNSKLSWRSRHRSPAKKKVLDFQIFIFDPLCSQLRANNEAKLNELKSNFKDAKIFFDDSIFIPNVDGNVLTIQHEEIEKKAYISKQFFSFLKEKNLIQIKDKGNQNVLILVPNGLVSMVIGTKGKQIINLAKSTGTHIAVNQPVYKMLHRTISITGYPQNISDAIKNIYGIMEERYFEVKQAEIESPPLDIFETISTINVLLAEDCVKTITNPKTHFGVVLKNKYNVLCNFYRDKHHRYIEKTETVTSLKGTIVDIQASIGEILYKLHEFLEYEFEGKALYQLKILIPSIFVAKIIGAGGCMIQEIASLSGGAIIRVLADKKSSKKQEEETVLSVVGSQNVILDASKKIIEQIENFKNGGPVLSTGKALFSSIPEQFKNCVILKKGIIVGSEMNNVNINNNNNNKPNDTSNNNNINYNNQFNHQNKGFQRKYYSRSRSRSISKSFNHNKYRGEFAENKRKIPNSNNYHNNDNNKEKHRDRDQKYKNRSVERDLRRNIEYKDNREGKNYKEYHNDKERRDEYFDNYNKPDNNYNNIGYNYDKQASKKMTYIEDNELCMATHIIVPENLVECIIGKRGESVKSIMSRTGTVVSLAKEYQNDCRVYIDKFIGRVCTIKGPLDNVIQAAKLIYETISNMESRNYNKI